MSICNRSTSRSAALPNSKIRVLSGCRIVRREGVGKKIVRLLLYESSRNVVLTRTWLAFRVRVLHHPLLDVARFETGITASEFVEVGAHAESWRHTRRRLLAKGPWRAVWGAWIGRRDYSGACRGARFSKRGLAFRGECGGRAENSRALYRNKGRERPSLMGSGGRAENARALDRSGGREHPRRRFETRSKKKEDLCT